MYLQPLETPPRSHLTPTLLTTYGLLLAVLLVGGGAAGAKMMVVLFPALSVGLGIYFYKYAPATYISFAWWMSFLAPVIRRMIDLKSSAFTFGPWNLTSLLVVLICGDRLLRDLPKLLSKNKGLPFILCAATIIYGVAISLLFGSQMKVIALTSWSWLTPVIFGYYIYANWRIYPEINQSIRRTFLWGALVMGLYGVYQYVLAPAWDVFWLQNQMGFYSSFGRPEPLGIRVFSTMNSPQAFGTVIMAGLLLLLTENRSPIVLPAIGLGTIAFILSMARAGWLSFVVGVPLLFFSLKPQLQIRFLLIIVIVSCLVGYAFTYPEFAELVTSRLDSFTHLDGDESFNDRFSGYGVLISLAISQIIGGGYGFVLPIKTDLILGDGAILPMLFSFGWIGTIPYLIGVILLVVELFKGQPSRWNSTSSVSRAIVIGILAQIGLNAMFIENLGLCLWCFLSLGIAANLFNQQQQRLQMLVESATSQTECSADSILSQSYVN